MSVTNRLSNQLLSSRQLTDIINSHSSSIADTVYINGKYKIVVVSVNYAASSTFNFTLRKSALVDIILVNGKAQPGPTGQDTMGSTNCCVCDGSDDRDFGGAGGDGGEGAAYKLVTDVYVTGSVANSISLTHAGDAAGFGKSTSGLTYGAQNIGGGQGGRSDFDEFCNSNHVGPSGTTTPSPGSPSLPTYTGGTTESWTGTSIAIGWSGGGGGGGDGDVGYTTAVGAQGSTLTGLGNGGGGGGGGTPYVGPTAGSNPSTGAAIVIRYQYRA